MGEAPDEEGVDTSDHDVADAAPDEEGAAAVHTSDADVADVDATQRSTQRLDALRTLESYVAESETGQAITYVPPVRAPEPRPWVDGALRISVFSNDDSCCWFVGAPQNVSRNQHVIRINCKRFHDERRTGRHDGRCCIIQRRILEARTKFMAVCHEVRQGLQQANRRDVLVGFWCNRGRHRITKNEETNKDTQTHKK
jgi:hypothetical protein